MLKMLKMCRYPGVLLLLAALSLSALAACGDGPGDDGATFQSLSDVNSGERSERGDDRPQANDPPRSEPLFPVFESPAASEVKAGQEGSPVVACDLRAKEGRMQADAYWDHFPDEVDGQSLAAYDYSWLVPNDDGTVADVGSRLDAGHQGTSLLDNAMPSGGTLQFRLVPRYGSDEDVYGQEFTVPCNPIG